MTRVAYAVVSCQEHELDVVAHVGSHVGFIGEAKFTAQERSVGDLTRLEHLRDLVQSPGAPPIKLAVFAGEGGFHPDLVTAAAARGAVEFIDLTRLYHGD